VITKSKEICQTLDVEVLGECEDGSGAVTAIQQPRPDLVFLDAQMPEMNGFDVISALGAEQMPLIVFVTAYDEFALRAFEAQALDYLLKPFGEERLQKVLERARVFLAGGAERAYQERLQTLLRVADKSQPTRLLVKSGDRTLVLRPAEIDWIEADDDYVHLHAGQQSHLLRAPLGELEQRLRGDGFVRIHRSRLVNLDRIKEFRPLSQGESVVVLKSGDRLNASKMACVFSRNASTRCVDLFFRRMDRAFWPSVVPCLRLRA